MDSIAQGRNHASKVGAIQAKARIRGAKRLRFEGGVQIEGEPQEKAGEGSEEWAKWAPP